MEKELIAQLFDRFEKACILMERVECWSARDLQEILAYTKWDNFLKVVEKAMLACDNAGELSDDHFVAVERLVGLGSGSERKVDDLALTRYACYLVAQNADPTKQEVAFAQTYFAVQTRKQEIVERRLLDVQRIHAREKLSQSEKKLSAVIYERGVDDQGFAIIRSQGDEALFGGLPTQEMKLRLNVPDKRPLADFLATLLIKAKDLAAELTTHNVVEKNLKGRRPISREHVENNQAVRKILGERGVKPEELPAEEDVKKVQRRLEMDGKKVKTAAKGIDRKKRLK